MKLLAATPHGILDYLVGLFLVSSPWLFGFHQVSDAATYTLVLIGSTVLLVSLITNYPLGLIRLLPFPAHGFIETIGAIALLLSPWLFGFSAVDPARNVALFGAIAYLAVIALTNYNPYQATHPNQRLSVSTPRQSH